MLPLLVAFRASVNTPSPPMVRTGGSVGWGAGWLDVGGCCWQPASSRAQAARISASVSLLCIDGCIGTLVEIFLFRCRDRRCHSHRGQRPWKSKNHLTLLFRPGFTIGHGHHPLSEPRVKSRRFACCQAGSCHVRLRSSTRKSSAASVAAGCGSIAKRSPSASAALTRTGFIGRSRFHRLATRRLAC